MASKMPVMIPSTNVSEKNTLLREIKSHRFSLQNFEINQIHKFIKICPLLPEMFHADTQRDRTKLIVVFRIYERANKFPCIL